MENDYLPEARSGPPPWLITFADLMVLLMCFFVLMLSFSEMDEEKFKIMSGSLSEAFGVQTDVTAADAPKSTSLDAAEFSPAIPEPTSANEVRQHTVDSDLNTLDLGLELRLRELKAQEDAAANQAQELRAVFQHDIDEGRLLIRQEGSNVVIQLLEKDSFPSGSAELEAGSRETLAGSGPRPGPIDGQRPRGHPTARGERHCGQSRVEPARRHHVRKRPRPARRLGDRGAGRTPALEEAGETPPPCPPPTAERVAFATARSVRGLECSNPAELFSRRVVRSRAGDGSFGGHRSVLTFNQMPYSPAQDVRFGSCACCL